MQKVILDTNVIVSALISDSIPTQILYELVFQRKTQVCASQEVLEEYVEVLSRDKFSKFPEFTSKANVVLAKLKEISDFYHIHEKIQILRDTSDDKFLELAVASSADYLITGNTRDFRMSQYEHTRIVTPREYWDKYIPID